MRVILRPESALQDKSHVLLDVVSMSQNDEGITITQDRDGSVRGVEMITIPKGVFSLLKATVLPDVEKPASGKVYKKDGAEGDLAE